MKKRQPPHPPKRELKRLRIFSEEFKRQCVADIENGLLSIKETSRLYRVSVTSVYRWLHRYSPHLEHHTRQVVELESEQHRTTALLERVAELERTIGQKQLTIDVLTKMLDQAGAELGDDWKKKLSTMFLPGSGTTDTSTDTP